MALSLRKRPSPLELDASKVVALACAMKERVLVLNLEGLGTARRRIQATTGQIRR